ncbi:MAG: hypothetical protein ACRCTR_08765 [Actinomycetota bacterium]
MLSFLPIASKDAEQGDVIAGWLLRLVVFTTFAGVVVFDSVSIFTTRLSLVEDSEIAAQAASARWIQSRNSQQSLRSATDAAQIEQSDNRVDSERFFLLADGTAEVTLERKASTLLFGSLPKIKSWTLIRVSAAKRAETL